MFTNLLVHPTPAVWRFLGFGSSIVGFSCYALTPSFHHLFGRWNLLKILLYSILTSIFSLLMLFVNRCPQFSRRFLLRTHLGFLVLMLTSLYSFYQDETQEKGYHGRLTLVSFGAFSLMSLSLSRQIQPDFDVGMSNFFLGCLIVAFMKINITIALAVAVLFYLVITIRSFMVSLLQPPNVGDSIMDIGSQVNEMQSLGNNINGEGEAQMIMVSESQIEMQNLAEENGDDETDSLIDTLEIWFRAYEGTANYSSPL